MPLDSVLRYPLDFIQPHFNQLFLYVLKLLDRSYAVPQWCSVTDDETVACFRQHRDTAVAAANRSRLHARAEEPAGQTYRGDEYSASLQSLLSPARRWRSWIRSRVLCTLSSSHVYQKNCSHIIANTIRFSCSHFSVKVIIMTRINTSPHSCTMLDPTRARTLTVLRSRNANPGSGSR